MRSIQRLASHIGAKLDGVRVRSHTLGGVVVEVYSAVFLHFEDRDAWISIVSLHGRTRVERVREPEIHPLDPAGGRSQHPIAALSRGHVVADAIGSRLVAVSEIVDATDARMSFGVELEFEGARARLLSIDGESMDLNAGRTPLRDDLERRALLHPVR